MDRVANVKVGVKDVGMEGEKWRVEWIADFCMFLNLFSFNVFLNSYGCSTTKLKTTPMETFFSQLKIQSMGLHNPWIPVIENCFLF